MEPRVALLYFKYTVSIMNIQENNSEINAHKLISVPLLLLAISFIGVFFAIYILNSGKSIELSESRLIEKNIRSSIVQWASSHEDRISARASVLSYYQCLGSQAGFSHADCLLIMGDDGFIGAVVKAVNKSKASHKMKYRYLGKQSNLAPR